MKTDNTLMNLRRLKKWFSKAIKAEESRTLEVEIENYYLSADYKLYKNEFNDIIMDVANKDGEAICTANVTYGVVLEINSDEYVKYLEMFAVNAPYVLLEKLA